MRSPVIRAAMACACLAPSLAACVTSDAAPPIDPSVASIAVTLPPPPVEVEPCLRQAFPEIPDRALTRADVVRIIGRAKVLDRAKVRCGERAIAWIEAVRRDFAKPETVHP